MSEKKLIIRQLAGNFFCNALSIFGNTSILKYKGKRILRDYTQSTKSYTIDYFWLAGFIQGDGSFVIRNNRVEYILYISQHIDDIQILYKIKKFIGYGYVRIQEKEKMAHYCLQQEVGLVNTLVALDGKFIGLKLLNYLKFLSYLNLSFYKLTDDFINFKNS